MEITEVKEGDSVIYYRVPTPDEWKRVGKVSYNFSIGDTVIVKKTSFDSIIVEFQGQRSMWIPINSFKFPDKPTEVKVGDYVVTLEGNFSETHCAKVNYCFLINKATGSMYVEKDTSGSTGNGNSNLKFDGTGRLKKWRFATETEIARYKRIGKPFDVTEEMQPSTTSTFTDRELMEFAKREYPVGTTFLTARDTGRSFTVNSPNYYWYTTTEITVDHFSGPSIYKDGVWGKIVRKPSITLESDDLQKGEIYALRNEYIFLSLGGKKAERYIDISCKDYQNSGGSFGATTGYRCATTEESDWLKACIKSSRFVSKEDSTKIIKGDPEALLEKAKKDYPIGTYYLDIEDGDRYQATMDPKLYCTEPGNYSIIVTYGGGLIYKQTSDEWAKIVKTSKTHEFKVGDWVKVIETGAGCGYDDQNKIVQITCVGQYSDSIGYKVDPPIGNTLSGSYGGFIGESSFTKCSPPKKPVAPVFKLGDWVVIDNLCRTEVGDSSSVLNGEIGHKGKVVRISEDLEPMYTLEPRCVGGSWFGHNLKKTEDPTQKAKSRYPSQPTIAELTASLAASFETRPSGIFVPPIPCSVFEWDIDVAHTPRHSSKMPKSILIPVKKI